MDSAGAGDEPVRSELIDELRAFLAEQWDPDLTVAQWWQRLGGAGWSAPTWPTEWGGRGLNMREGLAALATIAELGALGSPGGLGIMLAGPTILDHGSDEQKRRFLPPILTGQEGWCQLFSEPGAGSDLAGLTCRAERDGDEWVVNGQKVWTSNAREADLGMLLARTNVDVPKHQGISYFVLDMHQPGIEVRPLREMTGAALFNEVFITDARVHVDDCIGGIDNGWRVANSTLMHERTSLGAGGVMSAASRAMPGQVAGDLDRRAGDLVPSARNRPPAAGRAAHTRDVLVALAAERGRASDRVVRQGLARLHTYVEVARMNGLRLKAARRAGRDIPGLPNLDKLAASRIARLTREVGTLVLGADAMLHRYMSADDGSVQAMMGEQRTGGDVITRSIVSSPGPSIYGGTDQVQRNIVGERVLGLPKEPNQDKTLPFRALARNA